MVFDNSHYDTECFLNTVLLATANFINKGIWSVHSFNGDHLSMKTQVAVGTFFMKSPVRVGQIDIVH